MSKSNRSIPPACRYAEAASAEPQLQCSCAAQERTKKNYHYYLLGESVRIIEGSSWQPCTTSLALKSGSFGVKTQRVPTSLRFGNRDFNMRNSPSVSGNVALCSSHFFHSRATGTSFSCRASCEKNRVASILVDFIEYGTSFVNSKRPITACRQSC